MKRISRHVVVRWQLSHRFVVCGCPCVLPVAVAPLWQAKHCLGVPLKRPPTWHDAQSTLECEPVSGNPVEKWLNDEDKADWARPCAVTSTTAAAMTNNFRPNDLDEIIALYPPAASQDRFAPSGIRALQRSARSNLHRTALAFGTVRKRWSPQTDGCGAERALPSRRYRIQFVLEALLREAMSGGLGAVRARPLKHRRE
jgi:hypothetical protein